MKATTIIAAVSFIAVLSAGFVASAQPYTAGHVWYGQPYWAQHHASTYEEGVLRGGADLYRGMGQYNYLSSIAAINAQRARTAYLENRVKAVQTYFETRRINREARAAERGPKPTQQELVNLAKSRAPDRLADHQYEPALGKVFWPAVFDTEEYAVERAEIDQAMALRTVGNSGLGTENYHRIKSAIEKMQNRLKTHIHDMSGNEYVGAKKFLTSLAYEARFAPGIEGLAVR